MAGSRRRPREINKEEFIRENTKNCSPEKLGEELYIILHTAYLKQLGIENYRAEIIAMWNERLKSYISDSSFDYLRRNYCELVRPTIIERIKTPVVIESVKYLSKTIVSLEFDLWLIRTFRRKGSFNVKIFSRFLDGKYGSYTISAYKNFCSNDLMNCKNLQYLASQLDSYYERILEVFTRLFNVNKHIIPLVNENYAAKAAKTDESEGQADTSAESVSSVVSDVSGMNDVFVEPAGEEKAIVLGDISVPKTDAVSEYDIVLSEYAERITRLENDVKEFKRQRDELRKYSAEQYDKGVADLFRLMNDKRHGKIINYFYSLMNDESTDENLASYLGNLFLLFADMEIEPVAVDINEINNIDKDFLVKMYELDFTKKEYVKGRLAVKYDGWKYKDVIIEKPTLTIKEG